MQFAEKIRIRSTLLDGFTFDSVNEEIARDAVEGETTLPDLLKCFGEDIAFLHRNPQGFIEKPGCVFCFHDNPFFVRRRTSESDGHRALFLLAFLKLAGNRVGAMQSTANERA